VMSDGLVGERRVAKKRGDGIARGCFYATVSVACGDECALYFWLCVARKDADDSSVGCAEESVMEKCFWVVVSKRENGTLADVVLWSASQVKSATTSLTWPLRH
jgi:hypothetical protein